MNTSISNLIKQLTDRPQEISFEQVMAVIDEQYDFKPTAFTNGKQSNDADENSGSCKVFSFALLQKLNEEQTLSLFGQYYRDVINTPDGQDHQNIRQFMQFGFARLSFTAQALSDKG